jgi:hypothetical protein
VLVKDRASGVYSTHVAAAAAVALRPARGAPALRAALHRCVQQQHKFMNFSGCVPHKKSLHDSRAQQTQTMVAHAWSTSSTEDTV